MRKLLILAGLGAMLATTPVTAKDHGDRGRSNGRGHHEDNDERDGRGGWDSHRAAYSGDGRGYWNNGQYYRDGRMYGANCPRGLAKKNNGCLPPGHAQSRWGVGQRLPDQYRNSYIPSAYRDRYTGGTYRYYDGYVYRVDPRTYAIQQVIGALLR